MFAKKPEVWEITSIDEAHRILREKPNSEMRWMAIDYVRRFRAKELGYKEVLSLGEAKKVMNEKQPDIERLRRAVEYTCLYIALKGGVPEDVINSFDKAYLRLGEKGHSVALGILGSRFYLTEGELGKVKAVVRPAIAEDVGKKGEDVLRLLEREFGVNIKGTGFRKKVVSYPKSEVRDEGIVMKYRPLWLNKLEIDFESYTENAANLPDRYRPIAHELFHMLADERRGMLQLYFPKALDEGFPEYFGCKIAKRLTGVQPHYAYEDTGWPQMAEKIASVIGDEKALELFLNGHWKKMRELYDERKGEGAFAALLATAKSFK